MIEKKISVVAYRLTLPVDCRIFPVFHSAVLKPFVDDNLGEVVITIPSLTTESHPVVILTQIMAYRVIIRKDKKVKQVLVESEGLNPDERIWKMWKLWLA